MNIQPLKITIPLLSICLMGISPAAVITTTDDGSIREGQSSTVQDSGTGEHLYTRSDSGNYDNVRKAYLKFDLTGLNADLTESATFTTTISYRAKNQNGNRIFRFYGLDAGFTPTGSELGTDWDETALTWNNAPANDTLTNIATGFDNTATLIYSATNQYNSDVGKVYNITIPTLGDYTQTDNTVTLMISWTDGVQYGFGSKENSTEAYRPTLTFATIPEPGSIVLMLIGAAGLLIFRRRK